MKNNIVLIGYRATGKTTVGRHLSQKLKKPYISLDQEIVKQVGMPIAELVEKKGWEEFRKAETAIVKKASQLEGYIIDTGGGVITKKENINYLQKSGSIIWLKADLENIVDRLKKDNPRPSLTGKSFLDEVPEVLKERTPIYQKSANHIVDANKSILETVDQIKLLLKKKTIRKLGSNGFWIRLKGRGVLPV